ncbi:hypothetical protein HK096_004281 [Nowakowskiella sp. JEL0078]|nr:hypothetical protein HK096_004281 [Nowakowskiella sp. JEL0078]
MKEAFKYTLVYYNKGDHFGKFLALFSLLPYFILSSYVSLLLYTRNIRLAYFFVGQLLNYLLNGILKNYFQVERVRDDLDSEERFAFPSNHSQFISYSSVVALLLTNLFLHRFV